MRTIALFAAVATLAACASPGAPDAPDPLALDAPPVPLARYEWDTSAAMEALLEGPLTLRDGCLYVGDIVPAFPRHLASWDADTETLRYAGRDYNAGDVISAGGGVAASLDAIEIPSGCTLNQFGEVFLVQDEDLEPAS